MPTQGPELMFHSHRETRISEILFDSDIDIKECHVENDGRDRDEGKDVWKKNVRQYKILSVCQIVALEEFFISRNLPITKTNIKWAARELKIPYQRSADYLYNKYKKAQEDTANFYQRCINEFNVVTQNIERCWDLYLKGRQTYDMSFLRNDEN